MNGINIMSQIELNKKEKNKALLVAQIHPA
jgi:hypothetical protein